MRSSEKKGKKRWEKGRKKHEVKRSRGSAVGVGLENSMTKNFIKRQRSLKTKVFKTS